MSNDTCGPRRTLSLFGRSRWLCCTKSSVSKSHQLSQRPSDCIQVPRDLLHARNIHAQPDEPAGSTLWQITQSANQTEQECQHHETETKWQPPASLQTAGTRRGRCTAEKQPSTEQRTTPKHSKIYAPHLRGRGIYSCIKNSAEIEPNTWLHAALRAAICYTGIESRDFILALKIQYPRPHAPAPIGSYLSSTTQWYIYDGTKWKGGPTQNNGLESCLPQTQAAILISRQD